MLGDAAPSPPLSSPPPPVLLPPQAPLPPPQESPPPSLIVIPFSPPAVLSAILLPLAVVLRGSATGAGNSTSGTQAVPTLIQQLQEGTQAPAPPPPADVSSFASDLEGEGDDGAAGGVSSGLQLIGAGAGVFWRDS